MDTSPQPPANSTPPPYRLHVSLRAAIIGIAFLFGLLLAGSLAWFNYARNSQTALDVASELVLQAGSNVALRTRLMTQPVGFLTEHVQLLPGAGAEPKGFEHPLLPVFLEIMGDNPQLYSMYFGYGDGGFYQVIALKDRAALADKLKAPQGAAFAQRRITLKGEIRLEQWRFLDAERKELGVSAPEPATYDPRKRPWYVMASQMDGAVRTGLYFFNSTGELGLTVARRLKGATPMVFGVDLALDSLSRFLNQEKLSQAGLLFMFDADGGLIAHPDARSLAKAATLRSDARAVERADVQGLGDPLGLAVWQAFLKNGKGPVPVTRLSVDGVDYLCQVSRLTELGSDRDFLALLARADDFTGPLARTRDHSLLFALVLIFVAVPVLALLAARFSRGLKRLSEEADRIRSLELGSGLRLRSHIDELNHLGTAVASMRSALSSFSRYLPRTLVQQFIDSGLDPVLGGERRELTLLFTDVENFTPLAEHLTPEDLMQAMSEYFQLVGRAILDSGGTIDKFIGDAVMAFWNAPFEAENHVEQACLAALRLSQVSEELNVRRAAAGLPLLRTRVGLHTGPAVVGNVGAADRMDYTALGANVNLASRLEGLNKYYGTRILVTRSVRERTKSHFLFRSVDVVVPKGAEEPVAVFELLGGMPGGPHAGVAAERATLGFCSRWERAVTLYRTVQWEKALEEFTALAALRPDDRLAAMFCARTRRLMENRPGRDWKAIERFKGK